MSKTAGLLTSTIGRKLIVSVTGLFLILFLVVHASGNIQLFQNDGGRAFNEYTKFMTTFKPVKIISYLLYASIVVHAVWSLALWVYNRRARGTRYAMRRTNEITTWSSRNMAFLGTLLLIFIVIHLGNFWFVYKFGEIPKVTYDGQEYKDMYSVVATVFANPGYVAVYVICMIALGFHLYHGFGSAFQTLGLNHRKYTPAINLIGVIYSIVIPACFASMPLYFYFTN